MESPCWTHTYHDLQVTPVFGAFLAPKHWPLAPEPSTPEAPPVGKLPLTFWADRHPLASRWYSERTYKKLRSSKLFSHPVSLLLEAELPREQGEWMRVEVSAIPATDDQFAATLELHDKSQANPLIHHAVGGRIAVALGHHWVPIPGDLVEAVIFRASDSRARFAHYADWCFRFILMGRDDEAAERLLRSIPGIGGEREEAA